MSGATDVMQATSIKARMLALTDVLLEQSSFGKMERTIIHNLAHGFLKGNVTDEQLREQIIQVRDEIIPLLLGEETKHA